MRECWNFVKSKNIYYKEFENIYYEEHEWLNKRKIYIYKKPKYNIQFKLNKTIKNNFLLYVI